MWAGAAWLCALGKRVSLLASVLWLVGETLCLAGFTVPPGLRAYVWAAALQPLISSMQGSTCQTLCPSQWLGAGPAFASPECFVSAMASPESYGVLTVWGWLPATRQETCNLASMPPRLQSRILISAPPEPFALPQSRDGESGVAGASLVLALRSLTCTVPHRAWQPPQLGRSDPVVALLTYFSPADGPQDKVQISDDGVQASLPESPPFLFTPSPACWAPLLPLGLEGSFPLCGHILIPLCLVPCCSSCVLCSQKPSLILHRGEGLPPSDSMAPAWGGGDLISQLCDHLSELLGRPHQTVSCPMAEADTRVSPQQSVAGSRRSECSRILAES